MVTKLAVLRVSEAANLRLQEIDSQRMAIKVAGSGDKDSFTLLAHSSLEFLRGYWRMYKPRYTFYTSTQSAKSRVLKLSRKLNSAGGFVQHASIKSGLQISYTRNCSTILV